MLRTAQHHAPGAPRRSRLCRNILVSILPLIAGSPLAAAPAAGSPPDGAVPPAAPPYRAGQYYHRPPSVTDLKASQSVHPELKAVILEGRDLFLRTQERLGGRHVFNGLNCGNCHPGEGRIPWSGPIWPAATTLPAYRAKNRHVNTLEERIAGCFSYSMNGLPPPAGSREMVALIAYTRWLATGAPVYEDKIYGRGFRHLGNETPPATSRERGRVLYAQHCAVCHGASGEGVRHDQRWISPPLWGDQAYNWGSGMTRLFTAAAFIHLNMPLGRGGSLSEQEAWDLALYINSHERPQDPRYTGDVGETRSLYEDFHRFTLYGQTVDGRVLGDHSNTGAKPFLRPDIIRAREAPTNGPSAAFTPRPGASGHSS